MTGGIEWSLATLFPKDGIIELRALADRGCLTRPGKAPEDQVDRAVALHSRLDSVVDIFHLGLAEIEYFGDEIDFKGVTVAEK